MTVALCGKKVISVKGITVTTYVLAPFWSGYGLLILQQFTCPLQSPAEHI